MMLCLAVKKYGSLIQQSVHAVQHQTGTNDAVSDCQQSSLALCPVNGQ